MGDPLGRQPISDEEETAAELVWLARRTLPERDVIAAREIPFQKAAREHQEDFGSTPWGERPPISHARILYRDRDRDPVELLDRWAPAPLVPPEELIQLDDVLELLAQRGGPRARPYRANETVAVFEADGSERILLELDPGALAIVVYRWWRNLAGDNLVVDTLWFRIDTILSYERNLPWETGVLRRFFPREFPTLPGPDFEDRCRWWA